MIRVLRPVPVDRLKLLVFDLDGTLIDSAQDLCNSVNATLEQFGRPHLLDETIAGYIGNGALMLVRRAFAADNVNEPSEELLADAYKFFLDYYREHKLDYTYAYEGVLEALDALQKVHDQAYAPPRAMAVLTNKPVRPARAICEALGLAPYFLNIYGGNSFATKKPDPEGANRILSELKVAARNAAMVGDSEVDVQTARNAGMHAVCVNFGFGNHDRDAHPADVYVERFEELKHFVID